ncbi:hypothetical protein HMPREF9447_02204 [Bacteroides oleiciplenus YIT 12058]|uniref:Uncharacterized protein n=1 Tax=Bacteroides oleiciplenus YIT 12058 TaxID=742727 RepID=K9E4V1_9BACE|nr:hypothetical protein HMPREF9447_02204 [Bacteroides oleiciplenus YIT 12058]
MYQFIVGVTLQTYSEDAWNICTGVHFYVVIIKMKGSFEMY